MPGAATYHKTSSRMLSPVGVRRRLIRPRSPDFRLFPVASPALVRASSQRGASMVVANQYATQALARLVRKWDHRSLASVAGKAQQSDVSTQIMTAVGAADKSAERFCALTNIHALKSVTNLYAEHAIFRSTVVAIVAKFRKSFSAAIAVTRSPVSLSTQKSLGMQKSMNGLVLLNAATYVDDHMIVKSILVRSCAVHTLIRIIVRDLQMLFPTARVGKQASKRSPVRPEHLAKIPSQPAQSHV